jgi:hypothetical protein
VYSSALTRPVGACLAKDSPSATRTCPFCGRLAVWKRRETFSEPVVVQELADGL